MVGQPTTFETQVIGQDEANTYEKGIKNRQGPNNLLKADGPLASPCLWYHASYRNRLKLSI
jgi:hypothetical protein